MAISSGDMDGAVRDETGSLSVLIIALFLIVLIFSLNLINITDAFVAKRELVNVGEVALSQAAHTLSLDRYYAGDRTADDSAGDGQVYRVPIDCDVASLIFSHAISTAQLRGSTITISSWQCENDEITVGLTSSISSAVRLPLNMNSSREEIAVSMSATSILGGTR